jgi:23S rRNA pseudouridine1911/1915/1917 synthase
MRRLLPELSWSKVKRLIHRGLVRVNSVPCAEPAHAMRAGDFIGVASESPGSLPGSRDVRIVHCDEHLVVVDKPAPMLTARPEDEDPLHWDRRRGVRQVSVDEAVAAQIGQVVRIVHRLDRETSGLMLFARTEAAEQKLTRLFAEHEVQRTYLAVVHGVLDTATTIRSSLVRDRGDGLRGSLPAGVEDVAAKHAVTHVEPVERAGSFTIVRCRLETGRTHQIRIHLSEAGHRLCGERIYTHRIGCAPQPDASGAPRQALHSSQVRLVHPFTGAVLEYAIPLPADLAVWLGALGG